MRFREEVVNIQLAKLLSKYGLTANPETIEKSGRPDVFVNMGGLKVIIEGRFGTNPSLKADVKERVESGLADISMGIYYSRSLREADSLDELTVKIENETYDGVTCYFERTGLTLKGFHGVKLPDIVEMLNNIFHLYVQNDLVREYVKKVEKSLESVTQRASASGLFFQSEVLIERLKKTLGIQHEKETKKIRK